MSEDIFYQNSYRILGLLSLERGRVITRRGKEIIKLMRIGEMPTYPNDLFYPAQRRTIESVRQAMEKLGYEEGYVKDSFWWFQSQSEHDEKALILMQTFHIDEAFAIWNNACAQNPNDYVALKNIAIICTMLCYGSRLNHDYLETSVRIWGSLLHDEAFWSWFSGLCYHHDTLIITPKDNYPLSKKPVFMRFTACLRAFFMSESRAKTNKKPTDIIKCSAGSNVKIYVCILYAKISYLDTTLMPQQDTTGRSNARYVMIGSNGIYFRKITVTFQIPGGKNQLPFSNSFCGVNPACHAKQNRPH